MLFLSYLTVVHALEAHKVIIFKGWDNLVLVEEEDMEVRGGEGVERGGGMRSETLA